MARKRLDPAARLRAQALLREGKGPAEIERLTGIHESTIRAWQKKAAGPAPSNGAAGVHRVEAVPVPEGGGVPPQGGGGYDAARAAAGMGNGGAQGSGQAPPPKDAGPKIDPVLALVATSQLALKVAVRFYAARLHAKWDDELQKAVVFTQEEVATLSAYGPFVAPFLDEMLLKYGKYIGPAIYALAFYDMVLGRFALVKEKAPPPPKREERSAAPDGAPVATPEQMTGTAAP